MRRLRDAELDQSEYPEFRIQELSVLQHNTSFFLEESIEFLDEGR